MDNVWQSNGWSPQSASFTTNKIHFQERLKETKSNYQYSESYRTQNPFESKVTTNNIYLKQSQFTFGLKQSLP